MNTDNIDPKPYSEHSSSTTAFQVEVRCTTVSQHMPVVLQDGLVTESWREVHFSKGMNPCGVPVEDLGRFNTLMPYESALALAWTIIAQHRHSMGIQCRIVAYKHTEKVRVDYIGPVSSLDASDTQQGLPDPNDGGETDGIIKPTFGAYRYARRAQEKIAAEEEREVKNGTTASLVEEGILRKRKEACDTASAKAEAKGWNTPTPEQRMKHGLPAGVNLPL